MPTAAPISIEVTGYAEAQAALTGIKNGIERAGINASNQAGRFARKLAIAALARRFVADKKMLAKAMTGVQTARLSFPTAFFRVRSYIPNLMYFNATQDAVGVTSSIKSVEHAFVNRLTFGKPGKAMVFERTGIKRMIKKGTYAGKVREAIRGVKGMSAPAMFEAFRDMGPTILPQTRQKMSEALALQVTKLVAKHKAET